MSVYATKSRRVVGSNAGAGYELDAIAAVVLGGTSVFGGRGSLWGTLLGLCAISVLRNGVQLAALPSELAGVMTGAAGQAISWSKWCPARIGVRRIRKFGIQ